jgi:hypothetical protein
MHDSSNPFGFINPIMIITAQNAAVKGRPDIATDFGWRHD